MDLGLKGKVALVTGASRGIGRAIALALAGEGASVAICSRKEREIRKSEKEIASLHRVRCHAEARDLSRTGDVEAFVEGSVRALGPIDILVNNVGAGINKGFDDLSEKDWQEALEKNLWIALRLCRSVIPMMKKRRGGRIINIAALSGKVPRLGQIGSNVAKAALINLTESLACEMGAYGIRVNAVCPAAILTERWVARVKRVAEERGQSYEEALKELAGARIPAGRFGAPEDVAALVAFLASEKSDFINGVSIEVDGGAGRCGNLDLR